MINANLILSDKAKIFLNTIIDLRKKTTSSIELISFKNTKQWSVDRNSNIVHSSGGFFSIKGLKYKKGENDCFQPIIDQSEFGVLGLLVKIVKGTVYFLVQFKIEPGNKDIIQISPTVQATKSNYSRLHQGKSVKYIEYFLDYNKAQIIYNQKQSEQGIKFYKKRNLNMIAMVGADEVLEHSENHQWVSLETIIDLLKVDNIINMDLRSILSCLNLLELDGVTINKTTNSVGWLHSISPTKENDRKFNLSLHWINNIKINTLGTSELVNLEDVISNGWEFDNDVISNKLNKAFSVKFIKVSIAGREVGSWCQPIVEDKLEKINCFLIKKINGVYHFLAQACNEFGLKNGAEIGPTFHNIGIEDTPNSMFGKMLEDKSNNLIYSSVLSEEGGRFLYMENKYTIIEVNSDKIKELPEQYRWLTMYEMKKFLADECFVNVEARTLLSTFDWRNIGYEED